MMVRINPFRHSKPPDQNISQSLPYQAQQPRRSVFAVALVSHQRVNLPLPSKPVQAYYCGEQLSNSSRAKAIR
jgi:hypothetical protein